MRGTDINRYLYMVKKRKQMNFYCASVAMGCLAFFLAGCNNQPPSAGSVPTPKPGAVPVLVEDIDGNTYPTVQIADQVWMAENLRTTRYRNGDEIPYARTDRAWENEAEGMRCAYEHDDDNARTYGQLYNWFAVDDERGLCPSGWHVPSDEEWNTLERTLGLSSVDARQVGTRGIHAPALISEAWNGTNGSGFSALPGGSRNPTGGFYGVGGLAYFWSSSPSGSVAWDRGLDSGNGYVRRGYGSRRDGFSVRCVRD